MKAYTDLEQSKILSEILPLESADMYYLRDVYYPNAPITAPRIGSPVGIYTPCWSLSALLEVLPEIEGFRPIIDLDINLIRYEGNYRDKLCFNENNLIDACYEMILELNKEGLL